LDAGCAKGFLVRTLRERGKEAWGFDHSAWAIEHAEEAARPFLGLASVEKVEFERGHDVLLCFSLLESLTEEQALRFLSHARSQTRMALAAVILSRNEQDSGAGDSRDEDRDLSHITLHDRAWWRDLLGRAGWR